MESSYYALGREPPRRHSLMRAMVLAVVGIATGLVFVSMRSLDANNARSEVLQAARERFFDLSPHALRAADDSATFLTNESAPPSPLPSQPTPPQPTTLREFFKQRGSQLSEDQQLVVNMTKHAWHGYRKFAGWKDFLNVDALTGGTVYSHDMALTLVDSLDTLFVQGLHDEFDEASTWAKANLETTMLQRGSVNFFEITIRSLGGLLSAYYLSGERHFLDLAAKLGDGLLETFQCQPSVPCLNVDFVNKSAFGQTSIAEANTFQLEFLYLSHATNNSAYAEHAHAMNKIMQDLVKDRFTDGLVPTQIAWGSSGSVQSKISWGANGDSYFEYILKQWLQSDKRDDELKRQYLIAVDGMKARMLGKSAPSNFVYLGEISESGQLRPLMEHLTCFVPGLLALGYLHGMPSDHLDLAKELTRTCVEMYLASATNLAPEVTRFRVDESSQTSELFVSSDAAHNLLRPETIESLMILHRVTGDEVYRDYGRTIARAFEKNSKVAAGGYRAMCNVFQGPVTLCNDPRMESFFLAETLKYLFLLFSDNDVLPLNQIVFNTEAHPFPILKKPRVRNWHAALSVHSNLHLQPAMTEVIMFAPGWHRKWLLLLAALMTLYLCRYRLMGALVSKVATFCLAKKEPSLKIDVQVKLVLLWQLQLVHVEITGGGDDWTLLFTRITVHCYIKEFFRSFGQTKIWVLEIGDVIGELRHLDENLLRELLQREKQHNPPQAMTGSQRDTDGANPVGFLRFVDFQVAAIQLKLHCFESTTEFRCRNLSIGITEVLVKENLLHVKIQTTSVHARSYRQKHGSQDNEEGVIRDGISFDCSGLCFVADLQLMDRKLVGYKLIGVKDELVSVQLCTSFLEFVMLQQLKLIESGLFSAPNPQSLLAKHKRSPQSTELTKEISDTSISLVVIHELEDKRAIPLKFAAEITSFGTTKVEIQSDILLDFADENDATPTGTGFCHQAVVTNISATTGREFKQAILTLSTLEASVTQTHECKGHIECAIGAMEAFASPRIVMVLHSLAACDDRIKEYARQSKSLLSNAWRDAHPLLERHAPDLKRSSQIELDVVTKVQSWKVKTIFQAKHALAEEMMIDGDNTTMTAKVSHPVPSHAKRYDFRIAKIRTDFVTPFAKEKQRHSAVFLGAEFTIANDGNHGAGTSISSVDAKFQSVAVNRPTDDTSTQIRQFPVALMKEMNIKRQDSRTKESMDTEMSVSISDAHVEWNHRTHAKFLKEWSAIMAIVDKVGLMLSLPRNTSVSGDQVLPSPPIPKTLALDVRAKNTEVLLHEIRDVENVVAIQLTESKAVHQKQRLAIQTSFDCSLVSLLWGSSCPAIEVVGATFQQKVLLGPQRLLAKVPVQSKIKASQMEVFMRPNLRLLQLLLRFDELVNPKDEIKGGQVHEKPSTRQGLSFDCAQLSIEIHEKDPLTVDAGNQNREIHRATLESLEIKSVISKSFEISESMMRFVQMTRHGDTIDSSAYSHAIDQIMGVEGSISANTLVLMQSGKAFASSRDLEIQFAITDIVRTRTSSTTSAAERAYPPKTTIFDFSGLTKCCEITVEKKFHERLARILPVIQGTFDTQEVKTDNAESEVNDFDWRLRYTGNVDFGIQQCTVVVPYGDNSSSIVDFSYAGLGERIMRVSIKDFALNFRQFQKVAVHVSTVRVILEESVESASKVQVEPSLQLLYLPQLMFNGMIHWKENNAGKELLGDTAVLQSSVREFALSFELSVKSKIGAPSATQVPTLEEALLALNWDFVYPLLVYFLTEDEDDVTAVTSDQNGAESRLQCIGLQWDVSVDIVQIAFWDILTKEIGLLLVTNDFLSHGVATNSHRPRSQKLNNQSPWVIHEATTYVDLFRVYILRNPIRTDDYGEATVVESEVLPFDSTEVSNFFFETAGTSYRAILCPDMAEDDRSQDSDVESLFSECVGTFYERLHDNFMPIDFKFSLFGSTKLRKSNSLASVSSPSFTLPPMLTPSSSTTSFSPSPKSPRLWTQTVREKLMRLKRRSSSMDNLLLNDGSCPIQVDSMKLLWTIETRDTVFYMTSLTWDSIQRLAEANKDQRERLLSRFNDSRPATPAATEESVKINTWRPPSTLHKDASEGLRNNSSGPQRRGSTRDTLLDLLQQGKLGTKLASSPDEDGTQESGDVNAPKNPAGLGEGEELNACKSIAFKKYTLDIHDAQINIREENSQSSVLVATKHIHLEVGLDGLRSHTVAHLNFASVTAHVAPIDVDISAGVLWYAYSAVSPAHSPRGSASSCLLKQVMEECSLTMTYSQALVTGATAVEVDLSFLQLSTDRHQFYQLLNVMRHVLLAPPTIVRKPKRFQAPQSIRVNVPDLLEHEASDLMVFPASPSPSVNSMSAKKAHAQVVEELRSREAKQLNSRTSVIPLKFISFRVQGTQFRLQSSPETTGADHEFVEIRAEGIAGCHTYFSNQCTKLILNLQWMEINNLRPGPSSIAFEDAMAVLKAKLLVDKRYQSSSKVNLANQKGMLTIRAESGPLIRVLGQKLRVLDVLEVSMFPEISNIIVIQLASDFYELVYKFFFEQIGSPDHHDLNSEQVLFGRKAVAVSTGGQMSPSVRSTRATTGSGTPTHPSTPPQQPRRKSLQISGGSMNGLAPELNASFASNASTASGSITSSSATLESGSLEDDDSSTDGCELFYFKYVRIGNVKLRINCNGFFVNLSDFDLDLPPYVCQSKLCTWKKLLQKFESHLKWYVTKESASSGLSHFKNKFLKWTPSASSSSDKKDKNRKEEDSSMVNAQVLFGPYSGATT